MRDTKPHHPAANEDRAHKKGLARIIGHSPAIREAMRMTERYARRDHAVLITGESGTGKEIFARALHEESARAESPFVGFNCGLHSVDLIANELFGHETGAFSGAGPTSPGLIEQADGGTLFLNEINSLTLDAQPKLLCFLDEGEFRRLGCGPLRQADVRIISATNQNLEDQVRSGKFRRDLFHRLSVLPIRLPPLRERREDIPAFAKYWLELHTKLNDPVIPLFSVCAMNALVGHDWPGNIRELSSVILRAVVLSQADEITAEHLGLPAPNPKEANETFKTQKARLVSNWERQMLGQLLAAAHGSISHAANAAGMDRRAFYELLRKHHLNGFGHKQTAAVALLDHAIENEKTTSQYSESVL